MYRNEDKRKKRIIQTILPACLWIGIWWAAVHAVNGKLLLPIPDPPAAARSLIAVVRDLSFWKSLSLSALRVVSGFLAAFVTGCVLAAAARKAPVLRRFFSPVIRVMRTLPVACFIFVIYLWMSTGMIPGFISFIMALPPVYENIYEGIGAVDRDLVEMARVFGMDGKRRFLHVIIPSLRPFIASSAVSGLGMSWKAGIASEIICRPAGSIGNILWSMKTAIDYPGVFAVSVLILAAGIVSEEFLRRVLGGKR